ncbi:mitochondrial ribosomal protein S10 [Brevipalpus obovatus]|uniref:mitochondrial ribosomal protein S10 n=1 Tax=Brevipalpus obovatus TaxID=246614 RepID=UPI003D9ECC5C
MSIFISQLKPILHVASTGRLAALSLMRHCSGQELDKLYQKLVIDVRAHDPTVLESYEKFVNMTAKELSVEHVETWKPFRHIIRRALLASRFVHKDAREFYEFRTYFLMMEFKNLTGSTMDTFLEYIQRNLPEGVCMKATKTELARLPDHLNGKEASKAISSGA